MNIYFQLNNLFVNQLQFPLYGSIGNKKGELVLKRRQRLQIKGFSSLKQKALIFRAGDILKTHFKRGALGYYFEGICLAIRKKSFLSKNSSLLLRNVINGIGVEIIASYYLNRLYYLAFSDFKRKRFFYSKSKLFFLRLGENKEAGL